MTPPLEADPVINYEIALERLSGDTSMLATLAGFFLEDAPQLMTELHDGFKAGSTDIVFRRAHALKGLSATFEAIPFFRLAEEVESLARSKRESSLPSKIAAMQTEFDRLVLKLRDLTH